ncbi:MAG: GGDEF domain-containing protein [Terriglobales bacterium]
MNASHTRTDIWIVAISNYWRASALGATYFVVGFWVWGSSPGAMLTSSFFFVATLVGFALHQRLGWQHRSRQVALIVGQLFLGQALLIWQKSHLPLTDFTSTGNPLTRDFLVYLVSSLAVVAMSIFGGLIGALASLSMHYAFLFNVHEEFSFKWFFPIFMGLAGLVVNSAFRRLDKAYDQLEALANRDNLTGLLNRHSLVSEFERLQSVAQQTAQPLLLIAWDLDGLKQVNDQQGHAAGDACIRNFAAALQANIRGPNDARPGDAAFRIGGDEFISIHLAAGDGRKIVERVRQSGSWVSAGWILCNTITLDQALTQADRALYQSKQARKSSMALAASCD